MVSASAPVRAHLRSGATPIPLSQRYHRCSRLPRKDARHPGARGSDWCDRGQTARAPADAGGPPSAALSLSAELGLGAHNGPGRVPRGAWRAGADADHDVEFGWGELVDVFLYAAHAGLELG